MKNDIEFEANLDHGIIIQELGEPSNVRDYDIDLNPRIPEHVERAGVAEDTISILVVAQDPSKFLKIGSQLTPKLRERLTKFLKANLDVFAWSHEDNIGIDPNVICHRLNIDSIKKKDLAKEKALLWGKGWGSRVLLSYAAC